VVITIVEVGHRRNIYEWNRKHIEA
jgi:hypothetical protein